MKVLTRVHPELRRRNRTAARAWADRRWRTEVDRWFDHERAVLLEQNLELQRVELSGLDDAGLAAHLDACLQHFEDGMRRNLDTHGGDMMPLGDLFAHALRWGIDPSTMAELLVGSSPATVETAQLLRPVAAAVAAADQPPATMDDVRALSADAAAAVDAWTELHAWRLITSDDVDRPTLAELPGLKLQVLLGATDTEVPTPDPAPVRERVPVAERALFDELLAEARHGNRQRDDIRGLSWNWPGGLVRRAMLEAGRRLVSTGQLLDAEHAAELAPEEIDTLLRGGTGPDARVAAARAAARDRAEAAPPPRFFGEPEPEPPAGVFPAPLERATQAMMAVITVDVTAPQEHELHGIGVGKRTYQGRACVVRDAWEAADRLEPGDILIAPFTGPSFNSLLPLLGALVVEEGGPLCHAAIVAREFGVPALIGTNGAMSVPHGATVEVDPVAGVLRIVERPALAPDAHG